MRSYHLLMHIRSLGAWRAMTRMTLIAEGSSTGANPRGQKVQLQMLSMLGAGGMMRQTMQGMSLTVLSISHWRHRQSA